jgi:hypothetical protein
MAYKIKNKVDTGFPEPIWSIEEAKKLKEKSFAVKEEKEKAKKNLFLQEIKDRGEITEKELLLVKRRINDGTYTSKEAYDMLIGDNDGIKLTSDQQQKGYKWLYNKGFTSKGETRENSPFGYREEEILKNYSGIRLKDFYDAGHQDFKNVTPLYEVEGNDTSFEYYYHNGEVSIVG